jgi:hypothetical protein
MRLRRPASLLLVLALAGAGVAVVAVTASALGRGGLGAAADGPRIARVSVRAVERPFVDEDALAGAAAPAPAPQLLDREVTLDGSGFFGTSFGPFVRFVAPDGTSHDAVMVVIESGGRIVAWPPAGLRGTLQVVVENPDGQRASTTVGL